MSKFSFQIEPVAEFHNIRGKSPLRALRTKLFGKTGFRDWASAAVAPLAIPAAAPKRLGQAQARKPASIVAFRGKSARAAAPAPKAPVIQAEAQVTSGQAAAKPVEYKGHVISVTQMEDGSWIATHAHKGEAVAANGGRKQETYLARFLAIACAELEIDELEIRKLAA